MSFSLIIGPMFSGKTTELVRLCKRYDAVGKKVLICNSNKDTRNGLHKVSTHDGQTLEAKSIDMVTVHWFRNCIKDRYDVVAFDEGQFFENLRDVVEYLMNQGKDVIVAGLSGDANIGGWDTILKLLPLASNIIHTKAICVKCHADAPYTKRLKPAEDRVDIGASDKYMAVCYKCYNI